MPVEEERTKMCLLVRKSKERVEEAEDCGSGERCDHNELHRAWEASSCTPQAQHLCSHQIQR